MSQKNAASFFFLHFFLCFSLSFFTLVVFYMRWCIVAILTLRTIRIFLPVLFWGNTSCVFFLWHFKGFLLEFFEIFALVGKFLQFFLSV